MSQRSFWYPLLGLGFAIAGADKLMGQRGYRQMFRDWGWSPESRRLLGAAEFAGGVLVSSEMARPLGGVVLAAASASVLTSELCRGETNRALPRGALLLASLLAVLPSRSADDPQERLNTVA